MQLRPYQQAAVQELRQQYAAGKRAPICVAPTGAGKTVVASEVIRLAVQKQTRSLLVVPTIELLNQAVATLAVAGITDVRTIQAQNDIGREDAPVVVASIPTLVTPRWLANPVPADLVVVDECHHGKARTHEQLFSLYRSSKLLGLSATPQRGDGRALGDVFDSLVFCSSVRELTDLGSLVPCRVYAPGRVMSSRELAQDPVDAYEQRTPGQKAIVFCSTVEHARRTCDSFTSRGIRSSWICGESADREEILQAFARRDFDVLINVSLVIEGFDDPPTSAAILARRFTHVGSYLQALGRILRPSPGKQSATVVDLCGSALVHGTPDLEREYSLDGKGISSNRQAIRQCQECGGVFKQAPCCPYCQFATPPLTRQQAKALGIKLEEITAKSDRQSWPMRAKRKGFCASCSQPIEQGAWMIYSRTSRQAKHTKCAAQSAQSARKAA